MKLCNTCRRQESKSFRSQAQLFHLVKFKIKIYGTKYLTQTNDCGYPEYSESRRACFVENLQLDYSLHGVGSTSGTDSDGLLCKANSFTAAMGIYTTFQHRKKPFKRDPILHGHISTTKVNNTIV